MLIGGSYIGTEVAASLTAKGAKCTIVMMEEVALSRTFGEDAGRWFQDVLESKGVEVHGGEELEAFEGDGRVKAVVTKSGLTVECDAVVVGAGVQPGRDAGPARRARGRRRDRLRLEACRPRSRGSTRPATAAATTASSTGGGCGSSTGTWRCSRGWRRPGNMLGEEQATTTSSPTSSATSPTGPASSTSGRPTSGTRRSGAATARRASSSVWYLKDGKVAGALSVERSEDLGEARRMLADGVDVSGAKEQLGGSRQRPERDRVVELASGSASLSSSRKLRKL